MRTAFAVVVVILIGIGFGVGAAVMRIKSAPWNPILDQRLESAAAGGAKSSEPRPKVEVDQIEFNFGTLDINTKGNHDFTFRNTGNAPLKLTEGGTSCRCTMSKLSTDPIPPGGSAKVTLTWKPLERPGPYQQTAKILTNDPARPQVTLTVTGQITTAMLFSPPELVFSRLSSGESASGQAKLLYYLDEPLKILKRKWSDNSTASFFEFSEQPISAEEMKKEPLAKNGWLITVQIKPGMPQGPIQQKLLFETNLSSMREITLPIQGAVVSEISIFGRGWDADKEILNLGEVLRGEGIKRELTLVVRGPARKDVKFELLRINPGLMKVELGKPHEINKGAVIQLPLTIDIPKNSPPANHLGSEQGKLGEIILKTTHPLVPKLRILVRFAIEG
jgi:hypothetical protein